MDFTEKKKELEKQLKETEANYHRISGAIALINQLIADSNKKEAKKKEN